MDILLAFILMRYAEQLLRGCRPRPVNLYDDGLGVSILSSLSGRLVSLICQLKPALSSVSKLHNLNATR